MATEAFEEIAETFEFLDDWEDRYRHVIELGKAMPALDDAFRVPATKVDGCASQVWIRPIVEGAGPQARFDFHGESDAMIVPGADCPAPRALFRALRRGSRQGRCGGRARTARLAGSPIGPALQWVARHGRADPGIGRLKQQRRPRVKTH